MNTEPDQCHMYDGNSTCTHTMATASRLNYVNNHYTYALDLPLVHHAADLSRVLHTPLHGNIIYRPSQW